MAAAKSDHHRRQAEVCTEVLVIWCDYDTQLTDAEATAVGATPTLVIRDRRSKKFHTDAVSCKGIEDELPIETNLVDQFRRIRTRRTITTKNGDHIGMMQPFESTVCATHVATRRASSFKMFVESESMSGHLIAFRVVILSSSSCCTFFAQSSPKKN